MSFMTGIGARAATGAAVALLLGGVAGCAGSGGSASSGDGGGKVGGDLRVLSNWTGSEGDAFAKVIKGFEAKYPSVKVKIETVPFEQGQALLTQQYAQGSPPDVAVALPGLIRTFSEQGLLVNLDSTWDKWIADGEYTPAVRKIADGADSHTDSVLFKGNVNALIWYDPKQLAKLNLSVPKTWAQFTSVLNKSKAEGVAPFAVGGKDQWPLTQWTDSLLLRVAGASAFNDLAQGEIGWDDPRIVKSFKVYADMVRAYFPSTTLSSTFADATCARVAGKYLFENQGAFINLVDRQECGKDLVPGKDLSFFEMPSYGNTPAPKFVSGDLFMGAKDSKNPVATKALLEYLGSAQAQEIWAKIGGYVAPNAKVPASAYPNVNDRNAAALWPKNPSQEAGYDLDDWIGGEVQVKYEQALAQFVRDTDVSAFISKMKQIDTRSGH
ncbi:ABC transporter substrate-binding protein [Streptomyces sp. NPDC050564]|uniref:ABC transporter substrate-binding protein n=1 Tax=Streptomyces sp. NPDC050564 TaxID=3365631 RepID=UPI003794E994